MILVSVLVLFIASAGAAYAAFGPEEAPRIRYDVRAPRVVYRVERRK